MLANRGVPLKTQGKYRVLHEHGLPDLLLDVIATGA